MPRIANRDARPYVANREPFQGSNLFAFEYALVTVADEFGERIIQAYAADRLADQSRVIERWYVVYSYGSHFPIYIYAGGQWYANRDKFSRSTTRHQSQARPEYDGTRMTWLDTDEMKRLTEGVVRYMRAKVSMRVAA